MKILDIFLYLWVIFALLDRIQQLKLMRIQIRNPEYTIYAICIYLGKIQQDGAWLSFIKFECTNVLPLHVHLTAVALDLKQ
jgi:hypothetical protein